MAPKPNDRTKSARDAMVTGMDGSIFIGESDRRAKLFIYLPGSGVYEGTLDPTNPR